MDNYNYPEGSDTPNAPWNEPEPMFKECPECKGEGKAEYYNDEGNPYESQCEICLGDGSVAMTREEVEEYESNARCMKKYGFLP